MKTLLLFLAICLGVAYSQVLVPCSPPSLFEARMSRIEPARRFSERAKISYDGNNRRVRIIEEVNLLEDKEFFDILFIHNTEPGIEYRINLKSKECAKTEMTRPWRPFEVPPNATFLGESYIGSGGMPGAGVLTSLWSHTFEDGDKFFGIYTVEGCLPVLDEHYNNRTGMIDDSATFFDVTVGIRDPNVFIPPRECM